VTKLSPEQTRLLTQTEEAWQKYSAAVGALKAKHLAKMRAALLAEQAGLDSKIGGVMKAAQEGGVPLSQIKAVTTKGDARVKELIAGADAAATTDAIESLKPTAKIASHPDRPNVVTVTVDGVSADYEIAGGYVDPYHWSNAGWVAEHGSEHPVYAWMYERGGEKEVLEWFEKHQ